MRTESDLEGDQHSLHRFASVALVDPRGWILMQERDEFPVIDPERWGFPGGGVEPGEDYETAAHRELSEETGVVLAVGSLDLVGTFEVFHEHCGGYDEFALWTAYTERTDADVECHEGRRMVFVDPEEALTLPLTAAARLALPDFLESEHYRGLLS